MLFKEKKKEDIVHIQVRVTPAEREDLRKTAESNGMTVSDFIRKACNIYADILSNKK